MKQPRFPLKTTVLLLASFLVLTGFALTRPASSVKASYLNEEKLLSESTTAFDQMMEVVAHKRCVNCHPAGDRPRQGEDSHLHRFDVQRGQDGHGIAALSCHTCHQEENNRFSGVPGAPHWHLAPRSMGWEGLDRIEIARAMLDPSKNGNRSIEDIRHHLTNDPLVLWVFDPGVNSEGIPRETPPISKEAFIAAVNSWVDAGAPIPEK